MTLQEQLDGIAEKLSQLDVNNRGDLAEISRLTTMQNELLAQQALEERVQVQETKVAAIILPYDFNELFGDPNANDIVIELIKDLQRQAYAEHNGEHNELVSAHRDELRAAADRELQLKRQNDELQFENTSLSGVIEHGSAANKELTRENGDLRDHIQKVNLELEVTARERNVALAKVEELEIQLAEKAKEAVNVLHIAGNDRLATLVEQSKNAKVKSALDIALENAAPFRGKVIKDGEVVAPLYAPEVAPFQPIDQASDSGYQLVTGPVESVPADDQVIPSEAEVHSEPAPVATGQPETGTEAITADYLEQRLAWFATEHGLVSKGA
ncbi:hypothetical protein [Paenibacillus sp. LjRoot56]|uniref:hypothetical protein n=1 Tax=Paenibacillus sp. LjRoot56 TaxID=3342333 RepID=UPI003ECF3B7A